MNESMSGASQTPVAPKGRRFASAFVDLFLIPIILGLILGLLMIAVPDGPRSAILILVNIGWLLFRDVIYSPGRAIVKLKLISLTSEKVSWVQALIRNILLIVPFVLVVGYIVELVAVLAKGDRVADRWAKTRVVSAS